MRIVENLDLEICIITSHEYSLRVLDTYCYKISYGRKKESWFASTKRDSPKIIKRK